MQSPEHAGRMPAGHEVNSNVVEDRDNSAEEIDFRALGRALKRRQRTIVVPTLIAFVLVSILVNVVTPRYTADAEVLLENQENYFTRPDRFNAPPEQSLQVDQEGVASQVQLISSRDIARRAIKKLGLAGNSEFDPLAGGFNPVTRLLILLGLAPDPSRESADSRMVTKFLEKLSVYSPPKTRVISIAFTSRDPDLAARAANTVAQLYLQEQSAAKRATAKMTADALSTQIADLRTRLAQTDAERERYRLQYGLLAGSNNMTISGQQLADINSDLSKARATQADAQAKAEMIRQLIKEGKAANVADVINNDIVRRVSDQRFAAQAQLGREARTLLPGHPRIKELQAQLSEYDAALKSAAKQAASSLENEAKIAGQRVSNLEAALSQQKQQAGTSNADEVKLRAMDRLAQSLKDQLDSSGAKYQEALSRQASTATPADARIISGASRPQEPSFPKKVPFILFGTVAALVLSAGFVLVTELLGNRQASVPTDEAEVEHEAEMAHADEAAREPTSAVAHQKLWSFDNAPEGDAEPFAIAASSDSKAKARPSVEKLQRLGGAGLLAGLIEYAKMFGRSAAATRTQAHSREMAPSHSGFGWEHDATAWTAEAVEDHESEAPISPAAKPTVAGGSAAQGSVAQVSARVDLLVDKILRAHVPGRGLHVVGTCVGERTGPEAVIDLGRALSGKGRAIIVDLNRLPIALTQLADGGAGSTQTSHADIGQMRGLAELLAGDSTFAEVIHRDQGSRLHFIPTGLQEADFRDFDLILDALSETYDFIILLTPTHPKSEIAKIMAPYADFVVLVTSAPDAGSTRAIEAEMIDGGAREVLVAGAPTRRSLEVA